MLMVSREQKRETEKNQKYYIRQLKEGTTLTEKSLKVRYQSDAIKSHKTPTANVDRFPRTQILR